VSRAARLADRMFDRLRHRGAFAADDGDAVDGDFEPLRGRPYALLVTFRRNGAPVPSPVWFGIDRDGTVYVHTAEAAGKVKRLRNDDRVLLAPATARGKPLGPAIRGRARLLPEAEWAHAEAVLAAAYGTGRRIFGRMAAASGDPPAYLAITPGR
jgi:uncharacterized protein